ncbi:MAG: phosphate ABC transporter permease PstA [Halobacteriaceae archaeon]
MADGPFAADRTREQLRGAAFRLGLVVATLLGIVSLAVLVANVLKDAVQPATADPGWYAVVALGFLLPTAVAATAARRRPATWTVTRRALGALVGGLVLGALALVIPRALDPYDVLVYALGLVVPTAAVIAYDRVGPDSPWTGPALPLAAVAGVAGAGLLYGPLRTAVDVLAVWVVYLLLVALPVGAGVWAVARRRFGAGRGPRALGAAAVLVPGMAGLGGLFAPYDPVLAVVFVATLAVPTVLVVADALRGRAGAAGLLVPVVAVGSAGAALAVADRLGLHGPETWLTWTLLTENFSTISPERAGYYPQIVGSILLVGLMAVMVFPVGVAAAIYLEEYAPSTGLAGRLTQLVQVNISNLAGVPSVVYGLLGLGLFVRLAGQPRGLLYAASATLGLLILPIVIVSSQEAIRAVPDSHREASYGMGASRWQTVREVVLPSALPGILTGTILALGRAIGETAPILVIGVATSVTSPPSGLFAKATALPLQIFAARGEPDPAYRYGVLAAGVVVLLALMLSMNAVAIVLRNRFQR